MPEFANISATAVQIYVAPPSGVPSITVFNNSNAIVYLGGSAVTAVTGAPLYPNSQLQFIHANSPLWAVSGPGILGTATTLSANVASGTNATTMTATSGYGTGSTVIVGSGSAAEALTFATISGTSVTFTSNTRFAHLSGEAVGLSNAPQVSSVIIHRGTD